MVDPLILVADFLNQSNLGFTVQILEKKGPEEFYDPTDLLIAVIDFKARLRDLAPKNSKVIIMALQGFSQDEISEAVKISQGTISKILSRGRNILGEDVV